MRKEKKIRHVAENMFRDVKPTSDITPFTMGGSALRPCVCVYGLFLCLCICLLDSSRGRTERTFV